MTVLLMDIGHMVGSFIPLIFLCFLAIALGRWRWYYAGAVIQLLALIGEQYAYTEAGMGQPATLDCIITVVILAVVAPIVKRRKRYLLDKYPPQPK